MSTSDERREIARRLRAAAKTNSNSADYLWRRLEIAVNGWKFGDAVDDSYALNNDVLARLADLIDPTCNFEESAYNEEFAIRVVSGYICRACGHEAIVERTAGGWAEPPHYCSNCGARLVSDDE